MTVFFIDMGVFTKLGTIALASILRGASSNANDLANWGIAAFAIP